MSLDSEVTVATHTPGPHKADRPSVARTRVRQIRARVVTLARRYRAACEAYEQADADAEQGTGTLAAWDAAGEAMAQARNALFSALDELEIIEAGT